MFVVVTYPRYGGPELDHPDLHWGPGALESARAERDEKAARTAEAGRHEHHGIAEVIELEDEDA
jgi:hypothetical protein